MSEEVSPTTMSLSPGLTAAINAELPNGGVNATPEERLAAVERVYQMKGEAPFDPLNPSDMLARAFVIAESEE